VAVLAVCASGFSAASDGTPTLRDADTCFAERKFNCAQTLYERAQAEGIRFETDLPHARNLATTYLNSTPPDLTKAIPWLQVAITLDPQSDSLRAQLASSLNRSGNPEAAIDHYRILVESHPTSTEYGIQLATVLLQAGKSDAALQFLQASTEKFPGLVAFRIEYARLLNFTKQYPEARKQFLAALAIQPQNLIAQVGLAKATSYEGDQETAITMYDRIRQRHPGSYDAMVGKAFSLLWSGQAAQAGVLLRRASVRDPDDQEVREALSALPRSADEPATSPENRNRSLDTPRRAAVRRMPNSEMQGPHPSPSLNRTIASRIENPHPQPEPQHRYGIAATFIGFCLIAPLVYGRSRSSRMKSRSGETESSAAVGVIPETPEAASIQPPPDKRKAAAQPASVEDPMARPALPMSALAEEPASDTINILGCTSDYPLESYEPLAAAQESEAKAQLKILLSLATNFGSLVEGNSKLSADSGLDGPEGIAEAMCLGLTAPLQGQPTGQASNPPSR
jgi:tetratricopeptide (TPR) repeat protein